MAQTKTSKQQKAKPRVLGKTFAVLGLIIGIAGAVWHGLLGQPSLMELVYPWFSFANPLHAAGIIILWVVGGYIFGFLLAAIYNWVARR